MLPVSAAWKNANLQQFRNPAYLRMSIKLTPAGLSNNMVVTTDETFAYSSTDLFKEEAIGAVRPFASLEHKRWRLDGSFHLLSPGIITDDWWSKNAADTSQPILVFQFDKGYTIPGVFFRWDEVNLTYPTDIEITGYDGLGSVIKRIKISGINSHSGFYEAPLDNAFRIDIKILKWLYPNWKARIAEIIFGVGETYTSRDRITGATCSDSSDNINAKLPTSTFEVTLRNLDKYFDPLKRKGSSKYLLERQSVQYEWGFTVAPGVIEWAPKKQTYVTKYTIPPDSKDVVIRTGSRLDFLNTPFKIDTYGGTSRSLYSIAEKVLKSSEVIKDFVDQIPWELADALRNISTTAPIPNTNANAILQYVAQAAGLPLRTDPLSGFITIKALPKEIVHTITPSQQFGDPEVIPTDPVRSITAVINSYTLDEATSEIARSVYNLTLEQIVTVDYSDAAIEAKAEVTGATVLSVEYFTHCAIVKLLAPSTPTEVTIQVQGRKVINTQSTVVLYNDPTLSSGYNLVIDNPFITNLDTARPIAQLLLDRYKISQDFRVPYTGFPELESGDVILLDTIYGDVEVPVNTADLKFNGGWSGEVAILKGEEIRE